MRRRFAVAGIISVLLSIAVLFTLDRRGDKRQKAIERILQLDGEIVLSSGEVISDVAHSDWAFDNLKSILTISVGSEQSPISDSDIALFSALETESWSLDVRNVGVVGLNHLMHFSKLKDLLLRDLRVPIARFSGAIRAVESLQLIQEDTLKYVLDGVGDVPQLKTLALTYMTVGARDVADIVKADRLETLYLQRCTIQANALSGLAGLPRLTKLNLRGSQLDIASEMDALTSLDNLRVLDLTIVEVPEKYMAKIRAELRNCEIHH